MTCGELCKKIQLLPLLHIWKIFVSYVDMEITRDKKGDWIVKKKKDFRSAKLLPWLLILLAVIAALLLMRRSAVKIDLSKVDRLELVYTEHLGGTLGYLDASIDTITDAEEMEKIYKTLTARCILPHFGTDTSKLNGGTDEQIWRYQFFSGDEEVAAISVKNLPHYDEWSIGIGGSEFTILSSEETIREEFLRWFDPTEVETKFNAAYEEFFRQRD